MHTNRHTLLALVTALAWATLLTGAGLGARSDDGTLGARSAVSVDEAWAVAVQRDGKLVVAGMTIARDRGDFALARYTSRGALDPTFGRRGLVATDFGPPRRRDRAWAVAVQKDGRIVVAGESGEIGHEDLALARYRRDGRLDPTFGNGGQVLTDLGASSGDIANALAIQPDGKIVVTGESDANGNVEYAVVRYTPAGVLDPGFGAGGKVVTGFGGVGEGDSALAVVLQPDGKIVAAGQSDVDDSSNLSLARYTPDGRLDGSFGNGGRALTPLGSTYYWAVDAARTRDGKIVVSGVVDGDDFVIARYGRNGRLDARFGKKGMVETDFAKGSADVPFAVAMQGENVVAAGYYELDENENFQFALARYTQRGRLDTTFGRRGKVLTDFGGASIDRAFDVAIDAKRRIVAVGSRERGRTRDFAVARYLADGRLDPGFGKQGRAVTDFGRLG